MYCLGEFVWCFHFGVMESSDNSIFSIQIDRNLREYMIKKIVENCIQLIITPS